jgi:hypothetical protein
MPREVVGKKFNSRFCKRPIKIAGKRKQGHGMKHKSKKNGNCPWRFKANFCLWVGLENNIELKIILGAPGRIRTCDTQLRRLVLYPLSYGRVTGRETNSSGDLSQEPLGYWKR